MADKILARSIAAGVGAVAGAVLFNAFYCAFTDGQIPPKLATATACGLGAAFMVYVMVMVSE